ncbi:hypothetical protein [Croceivirga sp. JEA036]|uniref:hypothetical protein n=1 Tax=Croceivirga sp. JEA036 TaxID=2721162 RepID=UPI00143879A2|nr:hypothetical protein [Croceivirga sp. JEA036]NJB35909.1 hypothetical protein [Croceivirga sp. JEA036]
MAYFDVKQEVIERLKEALSDLNFFYEPELPGYFVYQEKEGVQAFFSLNLGSKVLQQTISHLRIKLLEVENKLLELESLPSFSISTVKNHKVGHSTICLKGSANQSLLTHQVDSKESSDLFVKNIRTYIVNHGLPFYERYSTLENVLDKMKELRREGKLWNEILDGGPEFLFKGLIISKLCKDTEFDELQSYVEKLVTEQLKDQAWVDAFESMKVLLSNT